MNYLVVTIKSWNIDQFKSLKKKDKKNNWYLITDKKDFTYARLKKINPKYIFIPHWSWIISKKIWSNFDTIVFHMTDLPYGRGGTPLQNLIVRGHQKTKVSAFKVNTGLDTGPIYLKKFLGLDGTAEEIYIRMSKVIFDMMIPYIIKNNPKPKKQQGRVVKFSRRTVEQSKIDNSFTLSKIYDHIRMLDAPTYPAAFLTTKKLRFEFYHAQKKGNNILEAKVKIYEKK